MNPVEEGIPVGSYWSRFFPASVGLAALAMILMPLPLLNYLGAVGIPATLVVLLHGRPERILLRIFPPLTAGCAAVLVYTPAGVVAFSLMVTGILIDIGIRKGWEWKKIGLAGSAPFLFWLVASIPFWSRAITWIREQYEIAMVPAVQWIINLGFEKTEVEASMAKSLDLWMQILPSMIVLTVLTIGFGALLVGIWWLRKRGEAVATVIPQLAVWDLPFYLVWPMIAGLALLLLTSGSIRTLCLNIVIVLGFLYMVQGFAIVWYSFEIRGTSALIRSLFTLLIAPIVFPGLIALGILENWVPFRRLMAEVAGNGTEEDQ